MKKTLRWAMLAAVFSLCVYHSSGLAQGQAVPGAQPMVGQQMAPSTAPPTRTALLDVPYIFKNYPRFKTMMEQLKRDVQQAEEQFKADRQQIRQLADTLQTLQKGSQDYKDLEEKIADREAKLQVNANRQKAAFLQQEARNYYAVYQEICRATDAFCRHYGFDMVLRFNREEGNPDNPESVLATINRPVVWQRGLDITQNVLDDLNRAAGIPAADQRAQPAPPTAPYGQPR